MVMIAVTSELRAKAGQEKQVEGLLLALANRTLEAEPGCLGYAVTHSRHDRHLFLTIERYADDPALDAHSRAEHFKEAFEQLMSRLEGPPRLALFDVLDA
jgi:quinol monooxygenase YgiN